MLRRRYKKLNAMKVGKSEAKYEYVENFQITIRRFGMCLVPQTST